MRLLPLESVLCILGQEHRVDMVVCRLQHRDWESLETGEQLPRSCRGEVTKVRLFFFVGHQFWRVECEDCRKRWIKLDSKINKGLWSQEENKRLHEAVAKYSTVSVPLHTPLKTTPLQCISTLLLIETNRIADGPRLLRQSALVNQTVSSFLT